MRGVPNTITPASWPVYSVVSLIIHYHDATAPIYKDDNRFLAAPDAAGYGFVRSVLRDDRAPPVLQQRKLGIGCIVQVTYVGITALAGFQRVRERAEGGV